jgi:hypothetical protein
VLGGEFRREVPRSSSAELTSTARDAKDLACPKFCFRHPLAALD